MRSPKMIQFRDGNGKRKTIRIGKQTSASREKIKTKIEALNVAKISGTSIDSDVAVWLANLPPKMYDRLVRAGLTGKRASTKITALEDFLADYCGSQSKIVKESTAIFYGHTKRNLLKYFGAKTPIADVTPGDADKFRIWLKTDEKLSESTIRRRCTLSRQIFRAAYRQKLILENPFSDMKGIGIQTNSTRQFFITKKVSEKILKACPNLEWQLIFALSRFGGLRCDPLPEN